MTKERPILFNTDMVLAILDDRKTVTRRVIKPPFEIHANGYISRPTKTERLAPYKSPYGQKGDVLYVKETWKPVAWSESGDNWDLRYRADGNSNTVKHLFDDDEKELDFWIKITDELKATECEEVDEMFREPERYLKWRPSIFMPKNAARIWLLVKDVRVERLQDITEDDAIAEGMDALQFPLRSFKMLWDSINEKRDGGKYRWDANPYVWRVEFEVITKTGRDNA